MQTPPAEAGPYRTNLGNACEMQLLQLEEMQATHEKELYESGVAGRSLSHLSEKEQNAITDASASGVPVRLAVYSHNLTYEDGRPPTHEYGVCFVVPKSKADADNLFKKPVSTYYAPVATIEHDTPVPYNDDHSPEAKRDARVVYSLVYELFVAKHNGQLPDLSLDLTTIGDTTRPYTPSPIISQ